LGKQDGVTAMRAKGQVRKRKREKTGKKERVENALERSENT